MNTSPAAPIPADWPHWSNTRPTLIRPLAEGLTNRSFLLKSDDRQLVLRINSPISVKLDLNRRAEERVLRLAHRAGLCAPLVYCDPEYRYLVTEYLGERRWSLSGGSSNEESIPQLASLLRNIHRLPIIEAQLDIKAKIESYWHSIAPDAVFIDALRANDQRVQQHIDAAVALNSGNKLCHNDLLSDNLIIDDTGRLYAIDWEYAAAGDPFHDLAVISEEHGLNEARQELLLNAYLQRLPSSNDRQRLSHGRIIYRYLSVLWYAVQCCHSTGTARATGKEVFRQIQLLNQKLSGTNL